MIDRGIKERLTAAIDIVLQEDISKEPGARRFLAERIVLLISDFVKENAPGATGNFPDGKSEATDEGQVKMLISHDDKLVRVEFGKPVAWFAMPKSQALTFGFSLLEHCGVKIEHKIQQDPAPGEPI